MDLIAIENLTRGTMVGTRIEVADSFCSRLIGLLGRKTLEPGGGLLIRPSSGVHTFGMRFPIDVVALDENRCVRFLWPRLRPWRLSGISWRIRSVLELPPGTIEQCGLRSGDQLALLVHGGSTLSG